jgi:ATP-binding cassette subfamily B protein
LTIQGDNFVAAMTTASSTARPLLKEISWPADRLSEALLALVEQGKFPVPAAEQREPARGSAELASNHGQPDLPATPAWLFQLDPPAVSEWVEGVANYLGVEASPVETTYREITVFLRQGGPVLLHLELEGEQRILALLKRDRWSGGQRLVVVGPDLKLHRPELELIRSALCKPVEQNGLKQVEELVEQAGVPARKRDRVSQSLLQERLGAVPLKVGWLLRTAPGASLWQEVRAAGLLKYFGSLSGIFVINRLCWVLSWLSLTAAILQGRIEWAWLLLWALFILCQIPTGAGRDWLLGLISIQAGIIIKRRLLQGALRLNPEEVRYQGAGQLLGRVIESEAVETLTLQGGLAVFLSLIEFAIAVPVLVAGASGGWLVLLLLAWLFGMGGSLAGWFWHTRRHWTGQRLDMTHDLVERLVGHRTRLAQEVPGGWHAAEDAALVDYLAASRKMDRPAAWLATFFQHGWLMSALLVLALAILGGQSSPVQIGLSLGGILLVYYPMLNVPGALINLACAATAWKQVAPIFYAAFRPVQAGNPQVRSAFLAQPEPEASSAKVDKSLAADLQAPGGKSPAIIQAYNLSFGYQGRAEAVLRGCQLQIRPGDQLLLQGPSGGGKSTFIALLAGLREANNGLLLLKGLDRQTLGEAGWRSGVVAAPQFHENYIITETFAFNLLMGRQWPPTQADLELAEEICHELGLGELVNRMPAGMFQVIGESGWQLSHGERSRLFIARALLQRAELIILDESFAALDPQTVQEAMECVLKRAPTLLVTAHP